MGNAISNLSKLSTREEVRDLRGCGFLLVQLRNTSAEEVCLFVFFLPNVPCVVGFRLQKQLPVVLVKY